MCDPQIATIGIGILVVVITLWQFEDHTIGFPLSILAQKESSNCHDTIRNSQNGTLKGLTVGFPTVESRRDE